MIVSFYVVYQTLSLCVSIRMHRNLDNSKFDRNEEKHIYFNTLIMLIPKYYFNATSNRILKIISKKQDVRSSDTVIILRGRMDEP